MRLIAFEFKLYYCWTIIQIIQRILPIIRKRFDVNPGLNLTPVELVKLPLKSRDELPPILTGLQWIFTTPEINQQIFDLVSKDVVGNKKKTTDNRQQISKSTEKQQFSNKP